MDQKEADAILALAPDYLSSFAQALVAQECELESARTRIVAVKNFMAVQGWPNWPPAPPAPEPAATPPS